MNWFDTLINAQSALQAVIILSLICACGLGLGKIRIFGISLGIAFVFFTGILAGHLGLAINPQMLDYAETFGLVLFVYTLGLQVGPGFFSSFHHGGLSLNLWGIGVILLGTIFALALGWLFSINLSDLVGILCGATTNTPALGAAQQTLQQLGISSNSPALGCAVSYPLGVVGVILGIFVLRKLFVKPSDLMPKKQDDEHHTYIATFQTVNPAIYNKSIAEIARMSHIKFIISRIWRNKQVIAPKSTDLLQKEDRLLVITTENEAAGLELLFGKKEAKDWNKEDIDWNSIDNKLESRVILISRTGLNGKTLGSLQLRNTYDINVSRVIRGDVKLLATNNLRLQYGDRVTVVGEASAIDHVEKFLGNAVQNLKEPNLAAIFIGIILGLALGSIPINLPGMSAPVKLGLAGGPIIVGILVGTFGPRLHMITYTTQSANLMLRKLGLSFYLACLGLDSGSHFFETVIRPEGLLWIGVGFLITVVPVIIIGFIALKTHKLDFGTICGMLCGSMANPMALSYADDTISGDTPSVSYATVYPLSMFLRVIIAQVIIMFFI